MSHGSQRASISFRDRPQHGEYVFGDLLATYSCISSGIALGVFKKGQRRRIQ